MFPLPDKAVLADQDLMGVAITQIIFSQAESLTLIIRVGCLLVEHCLSVFAVGLVRR